MICNLDQARPRSVSQQGCGKDNLKPTGFYRLTTRCNAICAFRAQSRFLEGDLQPFPVRIVLRYDQDSSQITTCQGQASTGFGFFSYTAHRGLLLKQLAV